MAELKFHVIQIESADLTALISWTRVRARESGSLPVWGQIVENLEDAQRTEIKWCDWDMPKEELPRNSIPLIRWNPHMDWQMGMSIPASLVPVLAGVGSTIPEDPKKARDEIVMNYLDGFNRTDLVEQYFGDMTEEQKDSIAEEYRRNME